MAEVGAWADENLGKFLTTPQCVLGPRELCATRSDLIIACDTGDAFDCIAVGQFLADTPPRLVVAEWFFLNACRIGEPLGCERLDELQGPSAILCERDPFACSVRAGRSGDLALHDEACSFGAADSCGYLVDVMRDDVEQSRAYLETACLLGSPMSCMELSHRHAGLHRQRSPRLLRAALANAALEIACALPAGKDPATSL